MFTGFNVRIVFLRLDITSSIFTNPNSRIILGIRVGRQSDSIPSVIQSDENEVEDSDLPAVTASYTRVTEEEYSSINVMTLKKRNVSNCRFV